MVNAKAFPESTVGVGGGRAEGARLLDEQRAARVAMARVFAAFEVSDGADHRVNEGARVSVGFALRVGEQRQVDGVQLVWEATSLRSNTPTCYSDRRVDVAVAAVVERGHSDGAGAADRLRQEAREREVRRDEGGSGGHATTRAYTRAT